MRWPFSFSWCCWWLLLNWLQVDYRGWCDLWYLRLVFRFSCCAWSYYHRSIALWIYLIWLFSLVGRGFIFLNSFRRLFFLFRGDFVITFCFCHYWFSLIIISGLFCCLFRYFYFIAVFLMILAYQQLCMSLFETICTTMTTYNTFPFFLILLMVLFIVTHWILFIFIGFCKSIVTEYVQLVDGSNVISLV